MLPTLPLQILSLVADVTIFVFVLYYLLKFHAKEKVLEKKEHETDTQYHHVVDDALAKERQIVSDATTEADQIIASAEYLSRDAKELVNKALQQMMADLQKDASVTAQTFADSYTASLKHLAIQSLADFQTIAKTLQIDLQQQVKSFHETVLPSMEKELESYKEARIKQTEQMISHVIQKVSQEVLNKAISLQDHQTLMLQALENAKKEGVFSQ